MYGIRDSWLNTGVEPTPSTAYQNLENSIRSGLFSGIPGMNFSAIYNPAAYGTTPQIPATSTNRALTDILNTQNVDETTDSQTRGGSSSVTDAIRNIMTSTHDVSSWVPNIPGYEGLAAASSADVANWLAGRMDPEAIADAKTLMAERGWDTGSFDSPNAAAAYQHFLGIKRQELMERAVQYYLQLLAQSPRTTTHDVTGSTTETGRTTTQATNWADAVSRRMGLTTSRQLGETQNIIDNNVMQAIYNAAPNSYAAAMANLAATQLGQRAGTAAAGATPTISLPNYTSFPRASTYTRPDTYSAPSIWAGPAIGSYGGGMFGGYSSSPAYTAPSMWSSSFANTPNYNLDYGNMYAERTNPSTGYYSGGGFSDWGLGDYMAGSDVNFLTDAEINAMIENV